MAKTNEVVTFGDLYVMTSFLSNAEFIHSNYFVDKTIHQVQCIYESSKLFFIISNQCDAIMVGTHHNHQNDYYLLTKTNQNKSLKVMWEYNNSSSSGTVSYCYIDLIVNRTGKKLKYHLAYPSHFNLYNENLMIYEIP